MKQGRSLTSLAAEIERQQTARVDLIVPATDMQFDSTSDIDNTRLVIASNDLATGLTQHVNNYAHGQIGTYLGIPKQYYDRMRTDQPTLLDTNVNHWLKAKTGDRRMLRTMDGNLRAFLSDKYRRLDNYELMSAILPTLLDTPGLTIASCDVTDTKLYIKATTDRITADVKLGDTVQAGIVISNSEVGAGAVSIYPLSFRLSCLNGMTHQDFGTRKNHVGRAADDSDSAFQLFSDETLQADDNAFFLKVRDILKGALSDEVFQRIVGQMREAMDAPKIKDPVRAIEVLGSRYQLPEVEKRGVLTSLIENSDLSMYGLVQAVTATAQTVPDYDRASELETLGGKLLSTKTEWPLFFNAHETMTKMPRTPSLALG